MAKPKYQTVTEELRDIIRAMPNHQKLDTLQHMQERFDCSPRTILKAIRILEKEGKLVSIQGSGFYVSKPHLDSENVDTHTVSASPHGRVLWTYRRPVLKVQIVGEDLDWQFKCWCELIRAFEKKHQNVSVEIVSWGKSYSESFSMTRPEADVVIVNHCELSNLYSLHPLLDIEHYLEYETDDQDFFPNIWEAGKTEGKLTGVPVYFTFPVLIHNLSLWREVGKEPPDAPSWEEFVKLLYAFKYDISRCEMKEMHILCSHVASFMRSLASGIKLFDSEEPMLIDSAENRREIRRSLEQLLTLKEIDPCYRILPNPVELFEAGNSMSLETWTNFPLKDGPWKVTMFPKRGKYLPATVVVAAVSMETIEPILAGEFAAFLAGESAQKIIAHYNRFPLRRSIAKSSDYSPPEWQNKELLIQVAENLKPIEVRQKAFWKFLWSIFDFEAKRLLMDNQDIEETVRNIFIRGAWYIKDLSEMDRRPVNEAIHKVKQLEYV